MRWLAVSLIALAGCALSDPHDEVRGTSDVAIVNYEGAAITEAEAMTHPAFLPFIRASWTLQRDEEWMELRLSGACDDECNTTFVLQLRDRGADRLPDFVGLKKIVTNLSLDPGKPDEVTVTNFRQGTIAIETWRPDARLTGRVTGDFSLTFWVNADA